MIKSRLVIILLTLLLTANSNAAFDVKARTVILQDYLSGEILFEKDADKSIYPASMTKIMTTIIAFDLIRSGDLNLDEKFFSVRECLETFVSWLFFNVYNGW